MRDQPVAFEGLDGKSVHPLSVLVTGGSGFVGRAVVERLLDQGCRVIATTTSAKPRCDEPRVRWVCWDASRTKLPEVAWESLDAIIHLATPRNLFTFPQGADALYSVAVEATFHLLEKARAHGLKRFLAASTGDVLGPSEGLASEDDRDYRPSSFYGAAKACEELLVQSYENALPAAVLRFYHPYGPGGDRFLINRLWNAARNRQEIRIEGQEGILLNPVWLDDLVNGICLALESHESGVFHLAGPEQATLFQLVTLMGEVLEIEPLIRHLPGAPVNRHAGSYERSRKLLGYVPEVGLVEGLRRLQPEFSRKVDLCRS